MAPIVQRHLQNNRYHASFIQPKSNFHCIVSYSWDLGTGTGGVSQPTQKWCITRVIARVDVSICVDLQISFVEAGG